MFVERFITGKPEQNRKLNLLVDAVKSLQNLNGDVFIRAANTPAGTTVRLNFAAILERIMKNSKGTGDTIYVGEVTSAINHEDDSAAIDAYTVQKINSSGVKDGTDITIDRAMGYEGYGSDGEDIRNFIPWFGVGARVPILEHFDDNESSAGEAKWFFFAPMTFIGKPADRSLDIEIETTVDESEFRAMAVWK